MPEHLIRLRGMAYCTLAQCTRLPLKLQKLDPVTELTAGGYGMRAVVAAATVDAPVAARELVERLVWCIARSVAASIGTGRLLEPGLRILTHCLHGAVAVRAIQREMLGHRVAQTLGLGTRMAVIAPIGIRGDIHQILVMRMHGIGKALDAFRSWFTQSDIGMAIST